MEQSDSAGEKQPRIRRGRVDSLCLYEITDYELDTIVHGSPESIYLNLAIFFLSIAVSFLVNTVTAAIPEKTYIVFVVIIVTTATAGIVLLILWLVNRRSRASIIKKIKDRMPPEPEESQDSQDEGMQP